MILDSCARLRVGRFGSYRFIGTLGFATAVALAFALHRAVGADAIAALLVSLAAPASFLVAVKLSYVVFGRERIVFYEKLLAALGASALALHIADRPIAPGLDLVVLGTGWFLGFGRVGCLMVGCCHGRPSRHGIAYGEEHARAGFPARLVGVRLFPIQLVDAALSLSLVAAGVVVAALPHAPGAPAVVWLEGYGVGRFVLEVARGDAARPRLARLTEAQWTAILVAWGVVWLHDSTPVTLGFAVALTVGGAAIAIVGPRWSLLGLASAWHVDELARALESLRRARDGDARTTSLGVRASVHRLPRANDYVISGIPEPTLARVLPQLGLRSPSIAPGRTPGLVHVLGARDEPDQ